jgi:hypothetical protein
MRLQRLLGLYAAVPVLTLAGCTRSRCCCAPCEPVTAAAREPSAPPPPRLLAAGGELGERGVLLETIVLRVPEDVASAEPMASAIALNGGHRVVSVEDGKALQARIYKAAGSKTLVAPSIVTAPGDEATLFIGETYAMEGQPESSTPSVGYDIDRPNWAGQRFRAVATPSPDRSSIALDFSFALREPPPKDAKPDFASLVANEVRGTASVSLPKGSGLLIVASAGAAAPKERVFVFVDATALGPKTKTTP